MVRSLLERIDAVHGKHMAAKTEVEAKMWEVVDAWKKTTEQHVQRTPKAELSVLVAKLQETEAWRIKALDRYEAVLGDLEEDKWPDDSYFEQPPSHEQMLCDGWLVFDPNFGQLLPNERAHYGLHGLPHEQEAYNDYGLHGLPHEQAAGFGQNTTAAGVSQDRISQQPPLHQAAGFVLPTAVDGVLGQLWAWALPYLWPTTTAADDSFEPQHSHQREAVFVQQHPAHEQAECFGAQIGGQRTAAPSGSSQPPDVGRQPTVTAAVDGSSFKQQQQLQMLRFELRHFEKRLKKRRKPPPEHLKKDMCRQW